MTASYWIPGGGNKESKDVKCLLCPHRCNIHEGKTGKCGVRRNINGGLIASAYGIVTSVALDPIEKKPLNEFHNGKKIVSIGSYGCNLHCPFCQNHSISLEYEGSAPGRIEPGEIADIAVRSISRGNIGVAYTYNEPLINYEFVKDCCALIRNAGLLNVLVTNGYINEEPLEELLPLIDAMNIDIKGGNKGIYDKVGGTQEKVKKVIKRSHRACHVEVTTLVIPGENEGDVEDIAIWLASIDKKIPYHLSRFFPRYKYKDRDATPHQTMHRLKDVACRHLERVYLGNM